MQCIQVLVSGERDIHRVVVSFPSNQQADRFGSTPNCTVSVFSQRRCGILEEVGTLVKVTVILRCFRQTPGTDLERNPAGTLYPSQVCRVSIKCIVCQSKLLNFHTKRQKYVVAQSDFIVRCQNFSQSICIFTRSNPYASTQLVLAR